MKHTIEARSFRVALACCHNFWVLKNADGHTLAELHGLAYDRIAGKILPIGTTKNHSLRVFAFAPLIQHAVRIAAIGCADDTAIVGQRPRAAIQGRECHRDDKKTARHGETAKEAHRDLFVEWMDAAYVT